MADNRKSRRHPRKPQGATYADMLAHKRLVRASVEQAAKDETVQLKSDIRTQRAMWLMVCSIADAFGFGPKNMARFFVALQENTDELEKMRTEVDEEYAYEKLRQKAEKVTGMKIQYLYEHEILEARKLHEVEGLVFNVP